jgi:hypothetical protein
MPTPSSDTNVAGQAGPSTRTAARPRPAPTATMTDGGDTMRFRAPTLDEAIALAETSLGARVRVVAANRIRRGGIGGFFASDLGVEVTVALDDESMEQALERLVAESEVDERSDFESRLVMQRLLEPSASSPIEPSSDRDRSAVGGGVGSRFDRRDDEPVPAVNPVLAEVLAALMAEAAERDASIGVATTAPVVTTVEPSAAVRDEAPTLIVGPTIEPDAELRPVYDTPPTMMRVDQIIEELSAITADPVFGGERARGRVARPTSVERVRRDDVATAAEAAMPPSAATSPAARPKVLPTLPPRPGEIARAASAASAANHHRLLASPAAVEASPRVVPAPRSPAAAFAAAATRAGTAAASPWPATQPTAQPTATPAATPAVATPAVATPTPTPTPTPTTAADDQAEMARMAESVRLVVGSEASVSHSLVVAGDGGVQASFEIDVDAGHDLDDHHDDDHDHHDHDHHDHDHHDHGPRARSVAAGRQPGSSSAPSRRQVELAIAATDQLIESLKRDDAVKRLSVRVVLRTGDRREVEAQAEWEGS